MEHFPSLRLQTIRSRVLSHPGHWLAKLAKLGPRRGNWIKAGNEKTASRADKLFISREATNSLDIRCKALVCEAAHPEIFLASQQAIRAERRVGWSCVNSFTLATLVLPYILASDWSLVPSTGLWLADGSAWHTGPCVILESDHWPVPPYECMARTTDHSHIH